MLCLSNVVLTCSPRLLSFHWRARTLPVGCTKVERECGRRFALVILQRDCARCSVFSSCSLEPLHPTATVCSNPWSLFLSNLHVFFLFVVTCWNHLVSACQQGSKKGAGNTADKPHARSRDKSLFVTADVRNPFEQFAQNFAKLSYAWGSH